MGEERAAPACLPVPDLELARRIPASGRVFLQEGRGCSRVGREGGAYREEVVHGWRRLSEERERDRDRRAEAGRRKVWPLRRGGEDAFKAET